MRFQIPAIAPPGHGQVDRPRDAARKYVSRLEERLGARLLHRTTRRLSLTEAGETYYRRAARALAELAEADQEASDHAGRPRGHLRVSAPSFFGATVLAHRLGAFHRRYPDITMDLVLSNRLVDLVAERFDCAVRIAAPRDSSLVQRRLAAIPVVTCAAPAYLERHGRPETPGALREHACLIYTLDTESRTWTYFRDDGSEYPVAVDGPLHINDDHTLRRAALDGLGVLRMPRLFLQDALDRGDLVQLWPDHTGPSVTLAVVYPSRHELPAKVRAFIDFMVTICAD